MVATAGASTLAAGRRFRMESPETPPRRLSSAVGSFWERHEMLRFVAVGGWNTLFGVGIFGLLLALFAGRLHYLGVMVISHVLAVTNAFAGHRWITFRVEGNLLVDYLRFNLSYLGILALGFVALPFLVEVAGLRPFWANCVLVLVTTLVSFVVHKRVSFRREPAGPA